MQIDLIYNTKVVGMQDLRRCSFQGSIVLLPASLFFSWNRNKNNYYSSTNLKISISSLQSKKTMVKELTWTLFKAAVTKETELDKRSHCCLEDTYKSATEDMKDRSGDWRRQMEECHSMKNLPHSVTEYCGM